MSLRSSKASFVFITALAMAIGAGVSGCGSDDDDGGGGGGGADCSSCPESARAECSSGYSDCVGAGMSASECQGLANDFCGLLSGLTDAGFTPVDSGAPPTGDSGAPTGDGG